MKITFGQNSIDISKARLYSMRYRAVRVADLSDEQVKQINQTKQLPEGYHLVYNINKYGRGDIFAGYEMNVTKELPKFNPLQKPFYFDTLQNGYELENYKGKTYLRESGTTVKEIKLKAYNTCLIASLTGTLLIIFALLKGKKSPKK